MITWFNEFLQFPHLLILVLLFFFSCRVRDCPGKLFPSSITCHNTFNVIQQLIYCFRNESSTSSLDRNDALFSRSYESRRPYSSRLDKDDATDYKKVYDLSGIL